MRIMLMAEETVTNVIPGQPWMYGVGAFVGLTALLYILTRVNPFR